MALALLMAAAPAWGRAPMRLGPAPPVAVHRVVTLAPSLTETVIALGAGARLVGVSRFDDALAVRDLPRVGGYTDPSVEAVLSLTPDLVIVEPSPGNRDAVERIAKLGAPVLAVPLSTEAEILAALREVGGALGSPARGAALADETLRRVDAVRARAAKLPRVRALVVYGWEPLVVAGPGSFGDQLLAAAGGENAARDAKSPFPVYGLETATAARPQAIIDAADVRVPERERILKLPGLVEARVAVTSPSLFRPGPRLAAAVEELFDALHPAAGPTQ